MRPTLVKGILLVVVEASKRLFRAPHAIRKSKHDKISPPRAQPRAQHVRRAANNRETQNILWEIRSFTTLKCSVDQALPLILSVDLPRSCPLSSTGAPSQ